MTVYVDDMYRYPVGRYGRMKMSHMIADHEIELGLMALAIGVDLKWWQYRGTRRSHFDISQSKRALAIKFGAKPITMHELGHWLKANNRS